MFTNVFFPVFYFLDMSFDKNSYFKIILIGYGLYFFFFYEGIICSGHWVKIASHLDISYKEPVSFSPTFTFILMTPEMGP